MKVNTNGSITAEAMSLAKRQQGVIKKQYSILKIFTYLQVLNTCKNKFLEVGCDFLIMTIHQIT